MQEQTRFDAVKKITLIGALKNAFLATIKILGGYFGQSHALLADGVHSLADLLTDGLVVVASKFGSKRPDEDHPYGHQRIETAATVLLAALLIVAGLGILWDAVSHLLSHSIIDTPKWYVLLIAVISILVNELLYQYTKITAEKTKSKLLQANAWHHRSDAASSLVVLIGVIGALLGLHFCDVLAAIIVSIMIIKMGWSLAWNCVLELVDTAASEEILQQIRNSILSIHGVKMIHQLRARHMGESLIVDVHVLVEPHITVSEGHFIATKVHHQLMQDVESVIDVTVHIDPENDEEVPTNLHLPLRLQVVQDIEQLAEDLSQTSFIEKIALHYLSGKISVDVFIKSEYANQCEVIKKSIESLTYVKQVQCYIEPVK